MKSPSQQVQALLENAFVPASSPAGRYLEWSQLLQYWLRKMSLSPKIIQKPQTRKGKEKVVKSRDEEQGWHDICNGEDKKDEDNTGSEEGNVSDRDVGPDTISDTFRARTLHHPCPLKME